MRTFYYHIRRYWLYFLAIPILVTLFSSLRVQNVITIEVFVSLVLTTVTLFISLINYYQNNDRFFKELFTDFNKRYDEMNEGLEKIQGEEKLNSQQHQLIIDYLNLCSEEYMWVRKGRIPFHIWESWKNGIKVHFQKTCIADIVRKERNLWKSSYYGFLDSLDIKAML